MNIHVLKCWPAYYDAIERGEKNFEVRRDDRGFQRGDIVELRRTYERDNYRVDTDLSGVPNHRMLRRIGWILTGGQFGVEPGYVVFSLLPVSTGPAPENDKACSPNTSAAGQRMREDSTDER